MTNYSDPVANFFFNTVPSWANKVGQSISNFFGGNSNTAFTAINPEMQSQYNNADFWTGLGNSFTGNLDYERSLETLAKDQKFNALEAEKARDFESLEAEKARQFSKVEAQLQRDFEERLSNTAYQRAAADLEAAGYNPALLLSAGGASTPSGAVASGYAAHSVAARSGAHNSPMLGDRALSTLVGIAKMIAGVASTTGRMALANEALADKLDIASRRMDLMQERNKIYGRSVQERANMNTMYYDVNKNKSGLDKAREEWYWTKINRAYRDMH